MNLLSNDKVISTYRFSISSWDQLPQCISNTSRELRLHVAHFINSPVLSGTRISVEHDKYGTLFAYTLMAEGNLIVPQYAQAHMTPALSPEQILSELKRFGFNIEFSPQCNLPDEQLDYLESIHKLNFDKIRLIAVDERVVYLVAFKVDHLSKWLDNTYSTTDYEFKSAIIEGHAINLTETSDATKYDWSWLATFVGSIPDILKVNGRIHN